jgi:ferredoxin
VPVRAEQSVIDAALACPGECIFIEMDVDVARTSAA